MLFVEKQGTKQAHMQRSTSVNNKYIDLSYWRKENVHQFGYFWPMWNLNMNTEISTITFGIFLV